MLMNTGDKIAHETETTESNLEAINIISNIV